ncbi:hypothetical protein FA95DRAFT_656835 [Auriscalpium vulgare]|uniref:Uncharacterized protein n=1 Tax=Auriscalpium vulgare TaxID=40419 RepID=A0ACB8RDH3_9AGAM|nr:hypothetical protein FA95DRAFT_656835 [Auriscalpium vulgare]
MSAVEGAFMPAVDGAFIECVDSDSEAYESDGESSESRSSYEEPYFTVEEDYDNFKTYFPDYDGNVPFETYFSRRFPSKFTYFPPPHASSASKFTSTPTSSSPEPTAPIAARLPPELLTQIFSILSAIEPPFSTNTLGWIGSATHVCRAWREAALGSPLLWATITLYDPNEPWAQEMLARTAEVPLRINVCIPDTGDDNLMLAESALSIAATHLPRLLELRIAGEFMTPSLVALLTTPAPVLAVLDIALDQGGRIFNMEPSDAELFLGGRAPKLRVLRVSGASQWFPWTSPVLRNLANLEVAPRQPEVSVGAVLRALGNMRSLQRLVLGLSFAPRMEGQEMIVLPHLEELDLTGSWKCATLFLQGLSMPVHTKFRMRVTDGRWSWLWMGSPDVAAFFTAVSSARSSSCSEEISALTVSPAAPSHPLNAFHPLILQTWRDSDASASPWTTLELPPESHLVPIGLSSLLATVVRVLSSERLRKLCMLVRCTEDDWSAILDVATGVEEIHAAHTAGSALCSVLHKSSINGPHSVRILAPQLCTLILRDLGVSSSPTQHLCAQLATCLAARARAGSRLTELDLTGCANLTEKHVWDLRKAVPGMDVVSHLYGLRYIYSWVGTDEGPWFVKNRRVPVDDL